MTNQKNLPTQQRKTAVEAPKTKEDALHLMKPISELFGPQDAAKNREAIGFELDMLADKLDLFDWRHTKADQKQHDPMKQARKDRRTQDWISVLGEYHVDAVRVAIASYLEWRSNELINGRRLKNAFPTEYDIKAFVMKRRSEKLVGLPKQMPQEPEPSNVRKISPERMADVQKLVEEKFPSLRKSH